jgi:hypothetical protein
MIPVYGCRQESSDLPLVRGGLEQKERSGYRRTAITTSAIYGLGNDPTRAIRRPVEFRPFWKSFSSAFPDLQIAVESTISEDDKVVARCAVRGTDGGYGEAGGIDRYKSPVSGDFELLDLRSLGHRPVVFQIRIVQDQVSR